MLYEKPQKVDKLVTVGWRCSFNSACISCSVLHEQGPSVPDTWLPRRSSQDSRQELYIETSTRSSPHSQMRNACPSFSHQGLPFCVSKSMSSLHKGRAKWQQAFISGGNRNTHSKPRCPWAPKRPCLSCRGYCLPFSTTLGSSRFLMFMPLSHFQAVMNGVFKTLLSCLYKFNSFRLSSLVICLIL